MKIRDRIRQALTRAAPLPIPRKGAAGTAFTLRLPDPEIDLRPIKTREEKLSAFAGWVYAASTTISTDVGATPWGLFTGSDDEDLERLPPQDVPPIFHRPNDLMTFRDVIELTTLHLDLAGEAFWNLITEGPESENVIGWQVVYPHWIEDPVVEGGKLTGWRVNIPNTTGASHTVIPTRDMIFFRYPHPTEPLCGASPVEAFALSHDLDMQARGYGAGLLKNNAIPPLVITSDQNLNARDAGILGERWKDRHLRRPGEPAVLGKGSTVQLLGLTLEQIGLEGIDKMTRQQVFGSYGVPESKKGLVEDVNRANAESNERTYQKNVIWPRLERIDTCINTFIIPRIPELANHIFHHDNPVQEDKDFRLETVDKLMGRGMITVNQGLRMLGEEEQPDGDVFYVPVNVDRIPAGQLGAPPAQPTDREIDVTALDPDSLKKLLDENPGHLEGITEEVEKNLAKKNGDERGSHIMDPNPMFELAELRFLSRQEPLERRLRSESRKTFSREQKDVVKAYQENADALLGRKQKYIKRWVEVPPEENGEAKGLPLTIPVVTRDAIDQAIDARQEEWIATLAAGAAIGHEAGWSLVAESLDITVDFNLIRARAAERAQREAARAAVEIGTTTKNRVQRIIALGIEEGQSTTAIAGQIRKEFDVFKGARAASIARTESAASINWAFNETVKETQLRTQTQLEKFWVTILDGLQREDHDRAHRQRQPVDQPFSVGGRSMQHPLDPNGGAAQVINCRCTMTVRKAPRSRRRAVKPSNQAQIGA